MPGRFELKPTLAKIWHAPDNFRIMEPLPLCIVVALSLPLSCW